MPSSCPYTVCRLHPWAGTALTPSTSAPDNKPIMSASFSHVHVCMRLDGVRDDDPNTNHNRQAALWTNWPTVPAAWCGA